MNASPSVLLSVEKINWSLFKFTEDAVLCFVKNNGNLLLIHKKTGLGAGKINAPGGRMEKGETRIQAAIRETTEETGIVPSDLFQAAELNFIFTNGYSLRGFVFFANSFSGVPINTREADPFWCPTDSIPYDKMWADDILWLPRVLAHEKILGRFIFDDDKMLSESVVPVTNFM